MPLNNRRILEIAQEPSATDCSCLASDFERPENTVRESKPAEGARRYLKLPHLCDLVSYGTNVVACCAPELIPGVEGFLRAMPNVPSCFETPGIYALNALLAPYDARVCFMAEYFLPDVDRVQAFRPHCEYPLRLLGPRDLAGLYIPQWHNALTMDQPERDALAVGAYDGDKLVGLAGCSADCDRMWQIGIDVLPEYRRRGIASALTNRLALECLARDIVPFYCAAWSNVRSVRNALRAGFRPGWVEVTAKPNAFIAQMAQRRQAPPDAPLPSGGPDCRACPASPR